MFGTLPQIINELQALLLERVATNLVQNAIRYNQPGGWVDVVTYDQGAYGLLVVANTGAQVPEHAVESLFEPFRRLEQPDGPSRPRDRGAGLGLSIVRAIVAAHLQTALSIAFC